MIINFTKLPSLENTYRQKEIDKIQSMMIQDKWIVTEKDKDALCCHQWVDGLDGGTMVCANKCGAWK